VAATGGLSGIIEGKTSPQPLFALLTVSNASPINLVE